MKVLKMFKSLLPLLLVVTLLGGTVQGALLDLGPNVPPVIGSTPPNLGHGFPLWYRDTNRVPLQLCVEEVPGCLPFAKPNPNQPVRYPDNMPDEIMYWSGQANLTVPGGAALLFAGVEVNFAVDDFGNVDRVSFARVRIRVDTTVAGDYRVITPFKVYEFKNVPVGGRAINFTEDIGLAGNNSFTGALAGNIGPFLYSVGAPFVTATGSYLGDGTARPVLGSGFTDPLTGQPANVFRIEGPPGFTTVSTNLFQITGKLYTEVTPTPLEVDRVTYARTSTGVQMNVFATTEALSNQVNPLAPFPLNFALTGAPSVLQLTGTDLPTQDLATNDPADGNFFSNSAMIPAPATLPAQVTVTNTADIPVTVKTVPLVDEVVVEKCYYNPDNKTLSVKASSYDTVGQPALQLFMPGREAALGTLDAGWLHIGFPFTDNGPPAKTYAIPPKTVTVKSALGGSASAPVNLYVPQFFPVTATAGPNGTISPAGARQVELGASQSYTITPNAGYRVQALVVDGVTLAGATSYTFSNVSAPHYINAYFAPLSFIISASAGTNGSVTPAGEVSADFGTARSFTFTPDPGFTVAELVVDGQTLPAASSYTFSNIAADHTIRANFVAGSFSIRAAAGSNGSISPAGVTSVSGGSTQNYTITPAPGYAVSALVVDGQTLPGATSYSFANLSANHYINAYFAPVDSSFTIRAAAGANGSITPAGASFVTSGADQSYTVTPNQGYVVSALVVDGQTLPGATSYTFPAVAAPHYINAYFAPAGPGFTIRAAAGANGSITPAGASFVLSGADQSYTITPNAGYEVSALVVDGAVLPGATSYTFPAVAQTHYINAYFAPLAP